MEYEDFLSLIDGYIECSSREYGEMPASIFFELLFERMSKEAIETIELEVDIVDDQLVLEPPEGRYRSSKMNSFRLNNSSL
jgi:hypothetical protein